MGRESLAQAAQEKPMHRWLSLAVAMLALAATPAIATASQGSVHFGPIASSSPDSGTCGNNWANDTYNRDFTVVQNQDSTFRVMEQFKDGNFVTIAGQSPGACDTNPGGTVSGGINGSFQGYFLITVSNATFTPNATCDTSTCGTTADFISTVFGSAATYDVTTFLFNYNSPDQSLALHHWKNASADRGGNVGDISN
jgi:hypothetical protein